MKLSTITILLASACKSSAQSQHNTSNTHPPALTLAKRHRKNRNSTAIPDMPTNKTSPTLIPDNKPTNKTSGGGGQPLCGEFENIQKDDYTLNNNLWGAKSATSGQQCTYYNGLTNDGGVTWSAQWTWNGAESQVKSYPFAGKQFTPKLVKDIRSMPSTFEWSYDRTDIKADVAYDLFTAADQNHEKSGGDFEMMLW